MSPSPVPHGTSKSSSFFSLPIYAAQIGPIYLATNKEAAAAASLLLYRSAQSAGIVVYRWIGDDVKIWKICKQKSNRSMMWRKISKWQPTTERDISRYIRYVYHWTKHMDVLVFQCRIIYEGGGVDESPWMELTKTHRLHHMVPCNIIFHEDIRQLSMLPLPPRQPTPFWVVWKTYFNHQLISTVW